MDQQIKEKKLCCRPHPMYDTLLCDREYGHDGLHRTSFHYETLKWGVPTYEEMYDTKKIK